MDKVIRGKKDAWHITRVEAMALEIELELLEFAA
jgi:hypothetical protein